MTPLIGETSSTTTRYEQPPHSYKLIAGGLMLGGLLTTMTWAAPATQAATDFGWTTVGVVTAARPAVSNADRIQSLKDRSGLSWAQVGTLFGVTRRAVHFWASGANMAVDHMDRLAIVEEVVDRYGAADAKSTRERLLTPDAAGRSPFNVLVDQWYRRPAGPSGIDLLVGGESRGYAAGKVLDSEPINLELRDL